MDSLIAQQIATNFTLYWFGLFSFLLPLWILKRWIFD